MKKVFLFAFLTIQLCGIAQNPEPKTQRINAHYSWSTVGANISVAYQFKFKSLEPFAGVMYHINRPVNDIRFFAYRHRFYHQNFADGLGINLGFTAPLPIKNSALNPYFIFISQASHMHNRFLLPNHDTASIASGGPDYVYYFSPFKMWILENNVGLGINVKAYGNFYLNASAAYGVVVYSVKNEFTGHSATWEFSDHYRIGISYLIPPRSK
jgi:hypothetical protein